MRVAPYSYDWVDNFGRRSPRHLIDGLDQLEVGQRFAIFRLVSFEGRPFDHARFHHRASRSCRDHVRGHTGQQRSEQAGGQAGVRGTRGLLGAVMRRILPAGDLVMMRKQLLTWRALAERDARDAERLRTTAS